MHIYRVAQKLLDTPCLATDGPYLSFMRQNVQACSDELERLSV